MVVTNAQAGRVSGRRGFTLVELLVVIGIITVLAAFLLPSIRGSFARSETAIAEADVQSLVKVWKSYFNEYGRWPVAAGSEFAFDGQPAGEAGMTDLSTGIVMSAVITTNILLCRFFYEGPQIQEYNPKRILFMDQASGSIDTESKFIDPWGNPYRVLFDLNRDGKVERDGGFAPVYDTVIAWSAGPDSNDTAVANEADNIKSWD